MYIHRKGVGSKSLIYTIAVRREMESKLKEVPQSIFKLRFTKFFLQFTTK